MLGPLAVPEARLAVPKAWLAFSEAWLAVLEAWIAYPKDWLDLRGGTYGKMEGSLEFLPILQEFASYRGQCPMNKVTISKERMESTFLKIK